MLVTAGLSNFILFFSLFFCSFLYFLLAANRPNKERRKKALKKERKKKDEDEDKEKEKKGKKRKRKQKKGPAWAAWRMGEILQS